MPTIKKPKTPKPVTQPQISESVRQELASKPITESQVVVHCEYTAQIFDDQIRIWRSTHLLDNDSSHCSDLVASENITLYPQWMPVKAMETVRFTLIFTGLPKSCKSFDLIEFIPESGGFECLNIRRNKTDVYFLVIG